MTELMYGRKVLKSAPRVCAYGAVDELNSVLGLARAHTKEAGIGAILLGVQERLFRLMTELAVDGQDQGRLERGPVSLLGEADREWMRAEIEDWSAGLDNRMKWVLPGEKSAQAYLDLGRTVCRRAEREVVELVESGGPVRAELIAFLNDLSYLLWLLERAS